MSVPPFNTPTARRHRKRRSLAATSALPAALTLVAATYDSGVPSVQLQFVRAISLADFDAAAFSVNDPADTGMTWSVASAALVNPTTVELQLADPSEATGSGTTLSATVDNGIKASGDGAAWAGVTNLELPFP